MIVWLAVNLLKIATHGESPSAVGTITAADMVNVTGNVKDAGSVAPG